MTEEQIAILERCVSAVMAEADWDADVGDGAVVVEYWAMDALEAAHIGHWHAAETLLERYETADWDARASYRGLPLCDVCTYRHKPNDTEMHREPAA